MTAVSKLQDDEIIEGSQFTFAAEKNINFWGKKKKKKKRLQVA